MCAGVTDRFLKLYPLLVLTLKDINNDPTSACHSSRELLTELMEPKVLWILIMLQSAMWKLWTTSKLFQRADTSCEDVISWVAELRGHVRGVILLSCHASQ